MRRQLVLAILGLLLLLMIFGSSSVGLYIDWLWFGEVGYQDVFATILTRQILLGLGIGVIAFGYVFANCLMAIRFSREGSLFVATGVNEMMEIAISPQRLRRIALLFAIVIAGFSALVAAGHWETVLQFFHRADAPERDPLFGRELSFYLFELPLWEYLLNVGFGLTIVSLIGVGVIYGVKGKLSVSLQGIEISRSAKVHLSVLAAVLFLFLAVSAYLDIPNLMYSPRGVIAGPSYTDVHAELPLLRALVTVCLIGALLLIGNCFTRKNRPVLVALGLYFLVMLASWFYPASVQKFSVEPNELVKETPYILHNVDATRKAYGVDGIEERTLTGENVLSQKDIEANDATISNVRLWDHAPLLDTFSQIQEIRTYYEFQSVDNDRYRINGKLQQIMLSPRELASNLLPNRTWINERLVFTHGYGITLGPVNRVTPEGLPLLFIKDLPPVSTIESQVKRPEIYYGELASNYVFTHTQEREFDYPSGDDNVYRDYTGEGGVPVNSWLRKLMLAVRFGSSEILLSNDITATSRVLFYRNIAERVRRIAPFLRYDPDPYLVVSDEGRLFWIQDAYTVTDRYPYAEPIQGLGNYIRNAVKVVIDAYHGDVQFYIADASDPLIQTWSRIFPNLFHPLNEMPSDLRAHIRYPVYLFSVQTHIYSTYHMRNPQVFYNKEDQWEIPVYSVGGKDQQMEPYYTIMKLPGEPQEEFILMLPFTPKQKDNMAAWMVARSDGPHYGKLIGYEFPKQKLVFGPRQISARINQDAEISRQISLWDQRGSQVIQGTLLVIPIEESLIYVQPLYLRAESGKIPELKRVIVAYQNQIAMEETLEQSLVKIFGGAPARAPEIVEEQPSEAAPPATPTVETLASQAKQHYDRAQEALRNGDWARYGNEMRQLGEVLRQMNQR